MEREIERLKNLRAQDIIAVNSGIIEEVYCDYCSKRANKMKKGKYKAVVSTAEEWFIAEISLKQYENFLAGMTVKIGII